MRQQRSNPIGDRVRSDCTSPTLPTVPLLPQSDVRRGSYSRAPRLQRGRGTNGPTSVVVEGGSRTASNSWDQKPSGCTMALGTCRVCGEPVTDEQLGRLAVT